MDKELGKELERKLEKDFINSYLGDSIANEKKLGIGSASINPNIYGSNLSGSIVISSPNQQSQPSTVVPVDTAVPTRDMLNDLKATLNDMAKSAKAVLDNLSQEYENAESRLNELTVRIEEIETCIKALDAE